MKKMIIPVLALLGMVACTNENEPEIINENGDPVEIKMVASMVDVNAKTRTVVEEGNAIEVAFARIDATTLPTDWKTGTEVAANIGSDKAITFPTPQYYSPTATMNSYFIGYYPKGILKDGAVTFTGMDGSQDILYATEVHGNKTSGNTALSPTFNHKLAQLQFKFVKDASFQKTDVTVNEITIKGTKLPVSLNIADGAITYAENATDITAFKSKIYAIEEAATATAIVPDNNLVGVGANGITLDITLSDGTTFTGVPVTLTTKEATAHIITLTFKQTSASGTATIGTWGSDTNNTDVQ